MWENSQNVFVNEKVKLQVGRMYIYICLCVWGLPLHGMFILANICVYKHIKNFFVYTQEKPEGAHQNIYNGWLLLWNKNRGQRDITEYRVDQGEFLFYTIYIFKNRKHDYLKTF